ncbi:D-tyrosyl-tRNA(Tyr) deacylase [bacterium BMS3Abin03]|nr:D-tyrosyl-tRNA(Tyr) deacylase [bacterium BMS3Abin03]MCG6961303.1 D-tyrosyl-tRNA(Tyr) deacylase [bacterium BMS3Abin03]
MKAVVQRVSQASVKIPSENYSAKIEKGLLILLGIKTGDTENDVNFVADKCCNLRIFEDENNKMNISVHEINGEVLIISQFTLYGETAKGNRPSFIEAAKPEEAIPLYNKFIGRMKINLGQEKIKCGIFGAIMDVSLINTGPVTVQVESKNN